MITINEELQNSLLKAKDDDIFTVVLVFKHLPDLENTPKLNDFPNRVMWRQALIKYRSNLIAERLGPTIKQLKSILDVVHGGDVTTTLIARGTAAQIWDAGKLPDLMKITLDKRDGQVLPYYED